MNVFVPLPYEDELFYNQVVRYMAEFPVSRQQVLIRELFGAVLQLSPHMPRNLSTLAARTEAVTGLGKEALFWSYTMYPFSCSYLSEELREEIFRYAYFGKSQRWMPGVLAAIVPPKYLRWCPGCVLEDRNRGDCGEAYWRRAHQLPGVWQCDKHLEELIDSSVPRFVTGLGHVVAEHAVPKLVDEFRRERIASSAETILRKRILSLLNSKEFVSRIAKPDYKSAALEAGFAAPGGLVDYHALYEAFADFWGDVLPRVDELHRTRGMGMGWLHGQFNARKPISQPVTRELIDIFFLEFGVTAGERPTTNTKPAASVFYCPNPYADHGAGMPVRKVSRSRLRHDRVSLTCACGLSVVAPSNVANRQIGMVDVIKVTRYGDTWLREFERLREEGMEWNAALAQLGVSSGQVGYWRRARTPQVNPLSDEERDAMRRGWIAILEQIAPERPKSAKTTYPQYAHLMRYDREWLEQTMHVYRQKYGIKLGATANWPARDEEYPERLAAAASRLLGREKKRVLTVSGLLMEARIDQGAVCRWKSKLPATIATLAKLTDDNLTPALRSAVSA